MSNTLKTQWKITSQMVLIHRKILIMQLQAVIHLPWNK